MQWNWDAQKTARWLTPAPEMAYLAERWRELGFRTLLDNGCGPGRHAVYFAKKGFSVTGLDQSPEALQYLTDWADREAVPVTAVQGDLFHLPFGDGNFDCLVDYNASYHTDTAGYRQAVAELKRVLKPGGEVFLTLLSQRDVQYQNASPEEKLDRFTLRHAGGTPHLYADRADLETIFAGFSFALPPREVIAPGLDNPVERVHFHLLLRKN